MIFAGFASALSVPQCLTPSSPTAVGRSQGQAQAVWNQLVRREQGEDTKYALIPFQNTFFSSHKAYGAVPGDGDAPTTRCFPCGRAAAACSAGTGRRAGSFYEEKHHYR